MTEPIDTPATRARQLVNAYRAAVNRETTWAQDRLAELREDYAKPPAQRRYRDHRGARNQLQGAISGRLEALHSRHVAAVQAELTEARQRLYALRKPDTAAIVEAQRVTDVQTAGELISLAADFGNYGLCAAIARVAEARGWVALDGTSPVHQLWAQVDEHAARYMAQCDEAEAAAGLIAKAIPYELGPLEPPGGFPKVAEAEPSILAER